MSSIICGSLAFDTIMNFEGRFAEHILPDQIHQLNVAFYLPTLRKEFGGCAGNIAYGLKQLGSEPIVVGCWGGDSALYRKHLEDLGISTKYIQTIEDHYTAQAMIMTDAAHNQITAFHPGAMVLAHQNPIPAELSTDSIGIVAPDGRDAMLEHATQLQARNIPFVFDPGQGLPMFNGDELLHFIEQASWITVNDYEAQMLIQRTGLELVQIAQKVRGLIVTLGEQGCQLWEGQENRHVPATAATALVDPTGCGDAFRAGLLFGLERNWSLTRCVQLGNQMGSLKVAHQGPQGYRVNFSID